MPGLTQTVGDQVSADELRALLARATEVKREFSADERAKAADKGHAMDDGSFPIKNAADLRNAIRLVGRAKNPADARKHIIERARALNLADLLPDDWNGGGKADGPDGVEVKDVSTGSAPAQSGRGFGSRTGGASGSADDPDGDGDVDTYLPCPKCGGRKARIEGGRPVCVKDGTPMREAPDGDADDESKAAPVGVQVKVADPYDFEQADNPDVDGFHGDVVEFSPAVDYKEVGAQVLAVDQRRGIVEAIVSVTGVEDRVRDIILPGAYQKTLQQRVPKGVWSHDWNQPVSKTLEVRELLPGDPALPATMRGPGGTQVPWPAEAGALWVKQQFNLLGERGRQAFADVVFFGDDQEWSIGYQVPAGESKINGTGTRLIKALDLYEYSPVLFGAMPAAATLSVKSAQAAYQAKVALEVGELERGRALLAEAGMETKGLDTLIADPAPVADAPASVAVADLVFLEQVACAAAEDDELEAKYDTSPVGEPGGRQNWVDKAGGMPPFLRAVAHALIRAGHTEAQAIQIAIGRIKAWARGGGNVSAKTRAKAASVVAWWESHTAGGKGLAEALDLLTKFDPSEARAANGTWTAGGSGGSGGPAKGGAVRTQPRGAVQPLRRERTQPHGDVRKLPGRASGHGSLHIQPHGGPTPILDRSKLDVHPEDAAALKKLAEMVGTFDPAGAKGLTDLAAGKKPSSSVEGYLRYLADTGGGDTAARVERLISATGRKKAQGQKVGVPLLERKADGWGRCPSCGSGDADEYADGTARCADCGFPLTPTAGKALPAGAADMEVKDLEERLHAVAAEWANLPGDEPLPDGLEASTAEVVVDAVLPDSLVATVLDPAAGVEQWRLEFVVDETGSIAVEAAELLDGGEPEPEPVLVGAGVEDKAGRMLSGLNVSTLQAAYTAIRDLLRRANALPDDAGGEPDADETKAVQFDDELPDFGIDPDWGQTMWADDEVKKFDPAERRDESGKWTDGGGGGGRKKHKLTAGTVLHSEHSSTATLTVLPNGDGEISAGRGTGKRRVPAGNLDAVANNGSWHGSRAEADAALTRNFRDGESTATRGAAGPFPKVEPGTYHHVSGDRLTVHADGSGTIESDGERDRLPKSEVASMLTTPHAGKHWTRHGGKKDALGGGDLEHATLTALEFDTLRARRLALEVDG
jgi:hypothetical protein